MVRAMFEKQKLGLPDIVGVDEPEVRPRDVNPVDEEYRSMLIELQSNFDAYRKEAGIDLRTLREQLDTAQKENGGLRIQLARFESQVKYQDGNIYSQVTN